MAGSITLLIPAYQPSEALVDLVQSVLAKDHTGVLGPILLIDDGSGPKFKELFDSLARLVRVAVVRHAVNLGKGAALKTGFNHALVTWPDTAGIVTADADGQHAAEDILKVATALAEAPQTMVLGVREFRGRMPLRSLVGNEVTRVVLRLFTGLRLLDTQTGLRGWPNKLCLESLSIPVNGYDFELESLIRAKAAGMASHLRQVPIQTIYLNGNQLSHFNPLWDSMRIYYVFLRYCASSVVTATVDYAVFLMALSQSQNVALSQFCARAAAVAVSFVLARSIVFRSHSNWLLSFLEFLFLVAAMGVVSYSMIQFMHTHLGIRVLLAKMIAEALLFLGNFAIQRAFIFSRK